jgi:hypothetical protein
MKNVFFLYPWSLSCCALCAYQNVRNDKSMLGITRHPCKKARSQEEQLPGEDFGYLGQVGLG